MSAVKCYVRRVSDSGDGVQRHVKVATAENEMINLFAKTDALRPRNVCERDDRL